MTIPAKSATVRSKSESGQVMIEFFLVALSLILLFSGAFTIGMMLSKALQVSNITRSAAVLMVRSITDPKADLNLALPQNQAILMHEAIGLGFVNNPASPSGNGAIFLSKVVLVGNNECAAAGLAAYASPPLYDSSNCHNFNSYVFAYYVAVGNTVRWASVFGTPPAVAIQADGSVTALNIAQDTSLEITGSTFPSIANMTLIQSQFALISETYADVSNIKIFSNYTPPVIYYRSIT